MEKLPPTRTVYRPMRIRNHISMLHVLAIIGAIGLVCTVGLAMWLLEYWRGQSTQIVQKQRQIEVLLVEVNEFNGVVDQFLLDSASTNMKLAERSAQRWLVSLVAMRHESPSWSRAIESTIAPLERMLHTYQQVHAAANGEPVAAPPNPERFRQDTQRFKQAMADLNRMASRHAKSGQAAFSLRRRYAMISIAVLCILYLFIVEHTRHAMTRRMVRPMEKLADAAIQAMSGRELLPRLENCGTNELDKLSQMLSSFVDVLKDKVSKRTAELESQKAALEHEVAVRRNAESQLRHAAFHDRLTGLCNRELLLDRLGQCIARTKRDDQYKFAVLFLDIDRFKEVNDSLGHNVGDELLISIADRFVGCLRKTDTISRCEANTVARIGGDEFVVLLDGLKQVDDAGVVAERLQQVLGEPMMLNEHEVFTTASIGIASSALYYDDPDDLLRDADAAMYQAKESGKARYEVFNQQMHSQAMDRLQFSNDLRRAIENTEIKVVYQPIISLRTGEICGFEALARWEHPKRGTVYPLDFIEHMEETGLIVALGKQVLEESCRRLRAWQDQFAHARLLSINVNVSRRQAADHALIEDVQAILDSTGIDGKFLNLEITESVIMSNVNSIAGVLTELKELGIAIHMDDFGTGYSSLSCLHRFPIDVLKIDREFVNTMDRNRDYAGVVQTVVALAHNLNMAVTVEGVENRDQLSQLVALDADFAQGFFFSKPLDIEEATALISTPYRWLPAA